MQELILDYVEFLSLVDDPAVGDSKYLVTKRAEETDNAENTETMTEEENPETDDEVVIKDAVAELSDQMSTMNDRLDTFESEFIDDDDDNEQDEQNEAIEEPAAERYTLDEIQAIADVVGGVDISADTTEESAESGDPDTSDDGDATKRKGKTGSGDGTSSTYVKSRSGRKVKDLKRAVEQAQRGDE